MDITRTHAVGIALLALVGGAATLALSRSSGEAPPTSAEASAESVQDAREPGPRRDETRDLARLAAKVDALTAEVEALRALVAQQRAAEGAGAQDEVLPSDAEQHEMWEEYVSYAEAGFNDEPTDARWAAEANSMIQHELAQQPALKSATKALECRSKSCRMELRDDGSTTFAKALPELVHSLGPQISSVVVDLVQDGKGKRTQVLYMTRADGRAERAL